MSKLDEIFELLRTSNVPGTTYVEIDPSSVRVVKQRVKYLVDSICFESDEPDSEKSLRSFDEIKEAIEEL